MCLTIFSACHYLI
uniref:Uncharacterized protein n=1 Tax=Arundo donax TaxID=35708 RepID=A0A0A8YP04_ARUDO